MEESEGGKRNRQKKEEEMEKRGRDGGTRR